MEAIVDKYPSDARILLWTGLIVGGTVFYILAIMFGAAQLEIPAQ